MDGDQFEKDTMSDFPENLHDMLINKWSYKPSQVDNVVRKLELMNEKVRIAFSKFLDGGEYPDNPNCFGLSPIDISTHYTFKPPAVFLMLDWIMQEPIEAMEFLVEEYHKPLPDSFDSKALSEYLAQKKEN